jgi:hypothetical protein
LETDKVRPRLHERVDVQIIVDGSNYPFYFEEIQFKAAGRINMVSLHALINALVKSNQKTFTVEFPKFGNSETFSLLDARKALGSAAAFLSGCE